MTPTIQILEHVSRVTPLGLRFWDSVSNRFIAEDLSVTAHPASNPERICPAVRTYSDVFVFQDLPGVARNEFGTGDTGYWAGLPQRLPFVIEMFDRAGRFLPMRFNADLPAQGLFVPGCLMPSDAPGIPLFSAPSRIAPGNLGAIRADLRDVFFNRPAAWAIAEATVANSPIRVRGMADEMGRLTLLLPWPEPVDAMIGSPVIASGPPLEQQSWSFSIRVWYSPVTPVPDMPDLCSAVRQAPATLWMDSTLSVPLNGGVLRYGRNSILQSKDLSVALLTTAASPPM